MSESLELIKYKKEEKSFSNLNDCYNNNKEVMTDKLKGNDDNDLNKKIKKREMQVLI